MTELTRRALLAATAAAGRGPGPARFRRAAA